MKHLLFLFSVLLISNNSKSQTQPPFGLNDPTFNQHDIIGNYIGDQFDFGPGIVDLVELDDGSVIIAGVFQTYQYSPVNYVVKLNPDGTLNTSFSSNIFGVNGIINSIAVQDDGKIYCVGEFNYFSGSVNKRIVRLNPDGTIDPTFQSGTGFNAPVTSIKIQDDGKIYCGGEFNGYNNQSTTWGITRLNPDGTKDSTFINNFACLGSIRQFNIQSDGKIIGVGDMVVIHPYGNNTSAILRINPNGSIDSAFSVNIGQGFLGGAGKRVALDDTGRILVAGSFDQFNGSGTYSNLIRLNPDGTIDNQFQCFGLTNVLDIEFHEPSKSLFVSANYNILKLDSTGLNIPNWDVLFPSAPYINPGIRLNIYLGSDHFIATGDILTIGEKSRESLGKWSVDGVLDRNYVSGYGANGGPIYNVEIDSQDRILISGAFKTFNNSSGAGFMRLDQDGRPDTSFYSKVRGISDFLVIDDTNYLVYGAFPPFIGPTVRLAKLTSNGSIDLGFNLGQSGPNNSILDAAVQSDGKIILIGDFTYYNGTSKQRIVRILPNGEIDNSFNVGTGFNNRPLNVIIQSDGKYIVSGKFTSYNGVSCREIVRLNPDGTRDFSYLPGTVPLTEDSDYTRIYMHPDNKILVRGAFSQFLGVAANGLVRLNGDGSVDTTFNVGNLAIGISSCKVQDSSIYISGYRLNPENQFVERFIKLNSDGSLNNQFVNHTADSTIYSFGFQSTGKIIIVGDFGSYDNFGKNRIARLFPCDPYWSEDQITSCDSITWHDMNTYSNDTNSVYFAFHSVNGCDSIVMLNLNILESTTSHENQMACDSYVWAINGLTYNSSGQYIYTIPNAVGCDSIVTLDLTIIPTIPLVSESLFSMPSDANSCTGQIAVTLSGNADFELDFGNGSQVLTSSGYSLVNGLCAGIHDLRVTDNCGDTLLTQVVIPLDSNYVFNNPFIDSLAQDSLGVTLTNCDIYYNSIDTAYIDSIWANGNMVNVIWNIVDSNGSNFDTTSYVLNNGNGVYWLQLSVFCPFKAMGGYFTVTEAIYFNNGSVSTAGLIDHKQALFEIYPNPTNNQVHISFSGTEAALVVYDIHGKVVLKDHIQNQGTVSLENVERGVYLFDLENSNGHSIQRVVKQ